MSHKRLTERERLTCTLDELEGIGLAFDTSTSKAADDWTRKRRRALRAQVFRLLRRSTSGGSK